VLLSISARALTHNTFFSHFQSFSIVFVRFNSGTLLLSISARVHPFYGRGAEDGVVWAEKKEKNKKKKKKGTPPWQWERRGEWRSSLGRKKEKKKRKEKERNTSVAMGETRRMA